MVWEQERGASLRKIRKQWLLNRQWMLGRQKTQVSATYVYPLNLNSPSFFIYKTCVLPCPNIYLYTKHTALPPPPGTPPSLQLLFLVNARPFTNPPLIFIFASVLRCAKELPSGRWHGPSVLYESLPFFTGPSFRESHSLHQYPLTPFAFVSVWAFKQQGRTTEVLRTPLRHFVKYQGVSIINTEEGRGISLLNSSWN